MPKSLPKFLFLSVMLVCCTVYACVAHDPAVMLFGLLVTGFIAFLD